MSKKFTKSALIFTSLLVGVTPAYAMPTTINLYGEEETKDATTGIEVNEVENIKPLAETTTPPPTTVVSEFTNSLNADGTLTVTGYTGTNLSVRVPDTIDGKVVTKIGSNAFANKGLQSVNISEGIREIGPSAFSNNAITSIILPNSLLTLGEGAFANNSLTSVSIPNGITALGIGAFKNNKITQFSLPTTMSIIPDQLFQNNMISQLMLPNNITSVGANAFSNNFIMSLTLNKGLQAIGENSFASNRISSLYIPNTVNTLGNNAFYGNNITSITMPKRFTGYVSQLTSNISSLSNLNLYSDTKDPGKDAPPSAGTDANGNIINGSGGKNLVTEDILSVGLQAGNLVLQKPKLTSNSFGNIVLGSTEIKRTLDFTTDLMVMDTRGTDEGWTLTVSATPFKEVEKAGGVAPTGGWFTLPTGTLSLASVGNVYKLNNKGEREVDTKGIKKNDGVNIPLDGGTVELAKADGTNSFGIWGIDFPDNALVFKINPANRLVDIDNYPNTPTPYASTITWTLVAGPGN